MSKEQRVAEVLALQRDGFEVVELNANQFRVNGVVDLYPVSRKYHDLSWNVRGTYETARQLVRQVAGR